MKHSLPRMTILLLALVLSACKKEAPTAGPPPEVTLADVVQQDVPIYIEAVGETRGSLTVEIRARVTGFLESMGFTEGGPVRRGQLLYQIDPKPFEATVARAKAQVAAAKAQFDNAELEETRLRPLAESDAVSRQEYDDAFADKQTAEASLEAARAAEQTASLDLGYAHITSPLNGIVGFTEAQIGDLVGPGQRSLLTTVSEADPIRVRFAIPEREYLRLYRQSLATGKGLKNQEQDIRMYLADGSEYPEKGEPRVANRAVDPGDGHLANRSQLPQSQRHHTARAVCPDQAPDRREERRAAGAPACSARAPGQLFGGRSDRRCQGKHEGRDAGRAGGLAVGDRPGHQAR